MTLNYGWYDVEKCQLNWLRVLYMCERTWVQVLCMLIFVLLLLLFKYMLIMLWNDMMSELDLLSMKYDLLNWLCS